MRISKPGTPAPACPPPAWPSVAAAASPPSLSSGARSPWSSDLKRKQEPRGAASTHAETLPAARRCALTERHPPADDLGGLLHVVDGGDGKTPVGNRAPEVLQEARRERQDASVAAESSRCFSQRQRGRETGDCPGSWLCPYLPTRCPPTPRPHRGNLGLAHVESFQGRPASYTTHSGLSVNLASTTLYKAVFQPIKTSLSLPSFHEDICQHLSKCRPSVGHVS